MRGAQAGEDLAVGVDAGGTWVRLVALREGRRAVRVRRRATPDLVALLRAEWRARGWGRVRALVVAARGVWTPGERRALAARLRGLAGRVQVLADVEAAHRGALGDAPGLLLLAGTGSIVLGRDAAGRWAREGGLGPLLGDEGSAFWIGREWLRARGDVTRARALARDPRAVARIAALAKGVLARARRGGAQERAIVRAAQAHLAAQAAAAAARLGLAPPLTVSWAGALLEAPWFRQGVVRALRASGVRARWVAPAASPVEAAARVAAALR